MEEGHWFRLPEYPAGVIWCPLCHLPETTGEYPEECHCWDNNGDELEVHSPAEPSLIDVVTEVHQNE